MKSIKNSLVIYIKMSNISSIIYLLSFLSYIIPLIIVELLNIDINFLSSNFIMTVAITLFILGNLLSFLKKDADDTSRSLNIGLIIVGIINIIARYLL